jgi:hypothetical protein
VIAEVSWDYHRGARELVFQVLKSGFVSMGDRAIDPNVKSVKTMYCAWCGWATKERSNSSSKPSHEDSREARTSLIAMEVAARTIAAVVKYMS